MKYVLLILVILFVSCSKNSDDNCWYCEFGASVSGSTPPPRTVCLPEGEEPGGFQDDNGNDLSFYCTEK